MLPDAAARVPVSAGQPTLLRPVTMVPAGAGAMRAAAQAAARRTAAAGGKAAASRPSISGVVRNAAGKGLPGICVTASTHTANSASADFTFTGRGGRYRFDLGRGMWEVSFANDCGAKYAPQWWKHVGSSAKATALHLRRGRHVTGIDARLVIGGVITGTVRAGRPSGPGLGGVCVVASGKGRAAGVRQQAVSHKDGSYRIRGLGTGGDRGPFPPHGGVNGRFFRTTRSGTSAGSTRDTHTGGDTSLFFATEIFPP